MVVRVAPVVREPLWRKERSCPGWGALDPDARNASLHDQPRDGETVFLAEFSARLWRTVRAPRIEIERTLFKGGPNYGESEFFDLPSSAPTVLGITAVLHTWGQKLDFHPHLHCIVTGGALSPDGKQWH